MVLDSLEILSRGPKFRVSNSQQYYLLDIKLKIDNNQPEESDHKSFSSITSY